MLVLSTTDPSCPALQKCIPHLLCAQPYTSDRFLSGVDPGRLGGWSCCRQFDPLQGESFLENRTITQSREDPSQELEQNQESLDPAVPKLDPSLNFLFRGAWVQLVKPPVLGFRAQVLISWGLESSPVRGTLHSEGSLLETLPLPPRRHALSCLLSL